MNRHASKIVGASFSPVGAPASPDIAITADASKVSGSDFFNALFPDFAAQREHRRQLDRKRCIRAIRNGDTFGFPPSMVEDCRAEAELPEEPETGWALAETSAYGMGAKA